VFAILSFLFGASIGSFVQVVVTRLHVAPIMKTRSKCLSCGEALRAFDLIPIFSYLFLKGKCRYCKTVYGISALIVEALYGAVFVALYYFFLQGQSSIFMVALLLTYYTLLFATFGVVALYDRMHSYIPVAYLMMYCVLTFLMLMVRYVAEPTSMVLLAPVIVALPFLLIWIVSKGKALGFGDVLLFLGVGAFFGVAQGIAVLLLSVWMGAIIGGGMYIVNAVNHDQKKPSNIVPFVPFIVIAFLIVLFTDIDIFSIASLFA